jgi:hypothetical protein
VGISISLVQVHIHTPSEHTEDDPPDAFGTRRRRQQSGVRDVAQLSFGNRPAASTVIVVGVPVAADHAVRPVLPLNGRLIRRGGA